MFKRLVVYSLFFFLFSTLAQANLYEVFNEEGHSVGKILGTVHSHAIVGSENENDRKLRNLIYTEVTNCTKAYTEHLHSKEFEEQGFTQDQLFANYLTTHVKSTSLKEGAPSFSAIFTKDERTKIIAKLEKSPINADQRITNQIVPLLDKFRPWYISLLLSTCPSLPPEKQKEVDHKIKVDGLDSLIMDGCKAEQKPLYPLETLETMMASVFVNAPEDQVAIKWIRTQISQDYFDPGIDLRPPYGESEEKWEAFFKAFAKQPESPLSNHESLILRNKLWAKVLDEDFKKGSKGVFAFVGIAHLYGESNLLELLKDRGYKIKRVF